jgi:hypothetical protein
MRLSGIGSISHMWPIKYLEKKGRHGCAALQRAGAQFGHSPGAYLYESYRRSMSFFVAVREPASRR